MHSIPSGRVVQTAQETDRLSHCPQCSGSGALTPIPGEGIPFFNLLIRACCHVGDRHRADLWLQHVVASGLRPNAQTFLPFLTQCAESGDVESVNHYFATMAGMGVPANACALHALMKACAVRRDFEGVQNVMATMRRRRMPIIAYTYHILLHACAKTARLLEAERYFAEMKTNGLLPTVTTYNCLINVCTRCDNVSRAQMWFERMTERGIEPNIVTFGTLCKAYAASGDVESVERVIQNCDANGRTLTIHLYASWLLACERARPRKKDNAERCFKLMIERGIPTESLFNRFVRLLGWNRAENVRRGSEEQNVRPAEDAFDTCGDLTVLGCLSL